MFVIVAKVTFVLRHCSKTNHSTTFLMVLVYICVSAMTNVYTFSNKYSNSINGNWLYS